VDFSLALIAPLPSRRVVLLPTVTEMLTASGADPANAPAGSVGAAPHACYNQLVETTSLFMRQIPASEAKIHLPRLLHDVERGETLVITRHGRPVARIVPEASRHQDEIDQAIADIKDLRKRTGRMTLEEIQSARREGQK